MPHRIAAVHVHRRAVLAAAAATLAPVPDQQQGDDASNQDDEEAGDDAADCGAGQPSVVATRWLVVDWDLVDVHGSEVRERRLLLHKHSQTSMLRSGPQRSCCRPVLSACLHRPQRSTLPPPIWHHKMLA